MFPIPSIGVLDSSDAAFAVLALRRIRAVASVFRGCAPALMPLFRVMKSSSWPSCAVVEHSIIAFLVTEGPTEAAGKLRRMDVVKAVQTYIQKMITEVPGMKVLLLDAHTVRCPNPDTGTRLTLIRRPSFPW